MKQIRKRLTYANVMSSLAIFLILGGATAFAAKKIGSTEIKGNAITTGKIKKEAVSRAKIKTGAVDSSKIEKEAITGDRIKLSTLGKVPSATKADNATTATTADNALALGGVAPTGYQPRARWAYISAAGTVLASGGGAAPKVIHPFAGGYYLEWGTPVTGFAIMSSLASSGEFSDVIATSPCGGAPLGVFCGEGSNTSSETFTYTTSSPGTEADRAFYIELVS